MIKISRKSFLAMAVVLSTALPAVAQADKYPQKPIRFITPTSSGSGADIMARRIADRLSRAVGQAVFVENLPGAGGIIGAETLIRSPADGYTVALISSNYVVFPHLHSKLNFDAVKDITPIAGVATTPIVLVARESFPANNVGELQALAKKTPEKISMGSSGNGTILHLVGSYMQELGGFKLMHIPYKGVAPVIPDLVSGVTDVAFFSYASVEGLVKSGKLKVLAVASARRAPNLPNVPTIGETIPGVNLDAWYAIVGPKNMPKDIVDRLNTEITNIVQSKEFQAQISAEGATPSPMKPDVLKTFIESEYAKHGRIVKSSGAKVE